MLSATKEKYRTFPIKLFLLIPKVTREDRNAIEVKTREYVKILRHDSLLIGSFGQLFPSLWVGNLFSVQVAPSDYITPKRAGYLNKINGIFVNNGLVKEWKTTI